MWVKSVTRLKKVDLGENQTLAADASNVKGERNVNMANTGVGQSRMPCRAVQVFRIEMRQASRSEEC